MMCKGPKVNRHPFGDYAAYVSGLERLAEKPRYVTDWDVHAVAALNGQASSELRRLTSVEIRRQFGVFFTGTDLSSRLLAHGDAIDTSSVFYDPTCGMGDLLLAAANRLPLCENLSETLHQWGRQISGTDLHREFVAGAKARLVLLARQRHKTDETLKIPCASFFPHIRVADGLRQRTMFRRATHFLLNPPFGLARAPMGCGWAGGRITDAAKFVVAALERAKPGAVMLAILPDVLRSGSFTAQWRGRVGELADVHLAKPYGLFDASADVDVFMLRLTRRRCQKRLCNRRWPAPALARTTVVADCFDVHVGRVVPQRDKEAGPCHLYIYPRCVPAWKVIRKLSESRKHQGQAFAPPFVVIRRTSRPGDMYRATASVIAGTMPVAVENHLIVCEPKDGKLATCGCLMRQLKTETVNEYLDARIRCRHLTVGAVSSIPFKPS